MPAREFVVLASQRTGSTLLVRSLDSASEIFCAGEMFHSGRHTHHREFQYPYPRPRGNPLARTVAALLQKKRVARHLAHFYDLAGAEVSAVGFKLMVSQADRYPAVVTWLRGRGVTGIFLYRRNTFDAALSYCMAEITGKYHSDQAARRADAEPVSIDEEEFRRCFNYCASDRARLLELHGSIGGTLFAYEDLVCKWDSTIAMIGRQLGLGGLRVSMSLEKISGKERMVIANEGELRASFAGGQLEP